VNTPTLSPSTSVSARGTTAPDLTRQAPRSPRVKLGGYAILPRCLDKGRATLAGTQGEYHFACPLDQQFLTFAGIDPEELRAQLAAGKSDTEILAWVQARAKHRRTPEEVDAWVRQQEKRTPADADSWAYFNELRTKVAPERQDIASWFDLLDVDDYASFGGRA
jgi:hypothetical protein